MQTQTDLERKWSDLLRLQQSVHTFRVKNKHFCFDVHKCSFFEIDAPTSAVLQAILDQRPWQETIAGPGGEVGCEKFVEAVDELHLLQEEGHFQAEDTLSRRRRLNTSLGSLCLIMATDCNLRCKYCFAHGGDYSKERKKMDFAVARKAVDYLIEKSGNRKDLAISFFGGEPLLNFGTIQRAVRYAREAASRRKKTVDFSITTNGTLLNDEMMSFFLAEGFSFIVSLDGPPDINDLYRVNRNGKGTYRRVVERLSRYSELYPDFKKKVTIRGTFPGESPDLVRSLEHLVSLGFSSISLEPTTMATAEFAVSEEHLEPLLGEYDRVADFYARCLRNGKHFSFFHILQLFEQVAEGPRRITQCGAGSGYLAIDPDGNIYPCHRIVANSKYLLGSVLGNTMNMPVQTLFREASVPYKKKCRQCWARYICGGGCHATAIHFHDDILEPYGIECTLMQHRIKLGAWVYSELTG
jgi:uncharacterized protein